MWRKTNDSLTIFVQGSKRFREPLNAPRCLALSPDGVLIVGDSATRELYRINSDGKPEAITSGKIGIPMDIAIASNGTIYVADLETRTVVRIAAGSNTQGSISADIATASQAGSGNNLCGL